MCNRGQSGVWSASRATLKVGRRVGAHRGPRHGRASGSRGFTGTHPDRTHPGQRVPAAHHPRERSAIIRLDRSARCCPHLGRHRRLEHGDRGTGRSPGRRPDRPGRLDQPDAGASSIRLGAREATITGKPRYTLTGSATFYDNGTTAMRLPRGTMVIGSAATAAASTGSSTTTARGPKSRIVDLYRPDFFKVCGCPSCAGTTQVTVSVY